MNEETITITLGDVSTLLQIIDVVSQRGAIQGQEMHGVGLMRNKLDAFLKQNEKGEQDERGIQGVKGDNGPQGTVQDKVVK